MMMVFVGQKSATFVILSPNLPTMMGINIIKSKIVGQNSGKKIKIRYYGALKKSKYNPKSANVSKSPYNNDKKSTIFQKISKIKRYNGGQKSEKVQHL